MRNVNTVQPDIVLTLHHNQYLCHARTSTLLCTRTALHTNDLYKVPHRVHHAGMRTHPTRRRSCGDSWCLTSGPRFSEATSLGERIFGMGNIRVVRRGAMVRTSSSEHALCRSAACTTLLTGVACAFPGGRSASPCVGPPMPATEPVITKERVENDGGPNGATYLMGRDGDGSMECM